MGQTLLSRNADDGAGLSDNGVMVSSLFTYLLTSGGVPEGNETAAPVGQGDSGCVRCRMGCRVSLSSSYIMINDDRFVNISFWVCSCLAEGHLIADSIGPTFPASAFSTRRRYRHTRDQRLASDKAEDISETLTVDCLRSRGLAQLLTGEDDPLRLGLYAFTEFMGRGLFALLLYFGAIALL